jgi:hypothetical protein
MPLLEEQIAEVQLIQASTGEGEFQWKGSAEELRAWEAAVAGDELGDRKISPLAFALCLDVDGDELWLNVNYRQEGEAQMTLQGPNISRLDLDRVKRVIDERQAEGIKEGEIAQREEHKDQHLKGPLHS